MRERADWRLVMIENSYATFTRYIPERRALLDRRALRALIPSYEIEPLWSARVDVGSVDRELASIVRYPNTDLYRAWVEALVALRALTREHGRAGLRPPQTSEERARVRLALSKLRRVAASYTDVPAICAAHAMAAVAACELNEARQAIRNAAAEDASRETLLLTQEIALREQNAPSVRAFLAKAYTMRQAQSDPWLAALNDGLQHPPRCP
jgi:hypothetical protein